jgi:tetratricopeptide (TPR) repeat protein
MWLLKDILRHRVPRAERGEPRDPDPYRYWAFISYNSKDKAWAHWLHRSIESYGIPARLVSGSTPTGEPAPRRLRPVFRDRAELPASADLGAEIEDALRASRYLIVICSPNAARSAWVGKEIQTFQSLGRAERILGLIVDGEPHSGDERECFPAALRGAEPAAADVRPGHDSKTDAKLKLLAGMLGIGFDALKQRDSRRRIRRLQIAMGVVLAVALAFAGIALYAEHQRDKAVKSRNEAESLVGYLMYDLTNKLKPLERWDIIAATQQRVDAYYAKMGVDEGGAGALRNQAQGLCTEGLLLEEQGDLEGALAKYREALAMFEDLAASDPDEGLLQSDLSWTHGLMGGMLESMGDLAGALREDRQAVAIDERLTAAYPDDEFFQRRLAMSHYELGNTLDASGNPEAAMQEFEKALAVIDAHDAQRTALVSDPNEAEWQRLSAYIHNNVGWVHEQQEDLSAALAEYEEALSLLQPLAATDPGDLNSQGYLAQYHNNIGRVLEAQGDFAEALQEHQAGLAIIMPLVAIDPSRSDRQQLAFSLHSSVGRGLQGQGDLDAALSEYQAALAVAENLVAVAPEDAYLEEQLGLAHRNLAGALEARGDFAAALNEYQKALTVFEALAASKPDDAYLQLLSSYVQADLDHVREKQQGGDD